MVEMAKSEDQDLKEVLKRISESPPIRIHATYHPSECVNGMLDSSATDYEQCTILDVINSYHIYCKLCQHHYYSCSKSNDINSFFQIHINSIDHIWNRQSCEWDKNKPIFHWEKWLYTGFCAICNESGIEAFIIDTHLDIVNILVDHVQRVGHKEKCRAIKEVRFDEILAKSDLLSNIYIGKISNGLYFCALCHLGIKREAFLEHHLNSVHHYQTFYWFLKKEFHVKIKNSYVQLDAEELAQQMKKLPMFKKSIVDINKRKIFYWNRVNSWNSQLKYLTEPQFGFNPSAIDKSYSVLDKDLRKASCCALCQEYPTNMDHHLNSNSHQLRVMIYNQCSSVRPVSVAEYLHTYRSTPIKLRVDVDKYWKYKSLLQKKGLDFGMPFKNEFLDINLNTESRDEWPVFEEICKRIENEKLTGRKIYLKDLQENVSGRNETKESSLPCPDSMKAKQEKDEGEIREMKRGDSLITNEKISKRDFSIVKSCIDHYLKNFEKATDKSNLPKTPVEDGELNCYSEAKSVLIQRYSDDPDFIHTFEKWNYLDTSYYVCVLCASNFRSPEYVFRHLRKRIHIHHFQKLKSGTLRRISPLNYSIDIGKGLYLCKLCYRPLCVIKHLQDFSIPRALKSIKEHAECTATKSVAVLENNAETLTYALKSMLMIGKESNVDESRGVHSVRKKAVQANTGNVVEKKGRKSVDNDENHVIKVEMKGNETKGVNSNNEKGSPKKAVVTKFEAKNNIVPDEKPKIVGRKRNSSNYPSLKQNIDLEGNLNNFLKHCGTGLTEFLCAICLVNDRLNTIEDHFKSESHRVNTDYVGSKWNVELGFCKYCQLLLVGTSDMFRQHYVSTYHGRRERVTRGRQYSYDCLNPRPVYTLFVKGLPQIGRDEKESWIRFWFSQFGAIKQVIVREKWVEVQFFDERVVGTIKSVKKFLGDNVQQISLYAKTVVREPEIAMNSSEIYILGYNKLNAFISSLTEKANIMMESKMEREKEENLVDSLQQVIGRIYPECKCFKFGSRVTGLIVGDCDLDVFLDYDNVYYGSDGALPEENKKQSKIVHRVAAALKASKLFVRVEGIGHCRVPIVTCLHKSTNIHCDISFKNGLSCENTNLIKFMISVDVRVKAVILFLKYWTKRNDLHGRPNFSSYALTMLVIFYLQQEPNPVLPTVEYLKSCYKEPQKVIGEWDCGFTTDINLIPKTKNTDSDLDLILGFFNFCNNFNFSEFVVSPLTGKKLSRELIQNKKKCSLPVPYDAYQSKIDENNYGVREPICIMDPFDLSHNLTKAFPQRSLKRFFYLCRLSAHLLSNSLKSKYFVHLHEHKM